MHPFADGLQDFDVHCGGAAVIAVVVCCTVRFTAFGTFCSCELLSSLFSNPWNDIVCVELENLGVGIHSVRVKDLGEFERFEYWLREIICEGIFIRATYIMSSHER
jgi:hypothetical protein